MYRAGNSGTDIDWSCPVRWDHPLNQGLLAWYLFVPGAIGGSTWINLADVPRWKMTLFGSIPTQTAWNDIPVRTGGWGGLKLAKTSSHYCEHFLPAVTAEPLSMTGWFRRTDTATNVIASIGTTGSSARHSLIANSVGPVVTATSVTSIGQASSASSAATASASVWHHGAAVFAAAADRRAYVDGGGKGVETTSRAVSGMNATDIGTEYSLGSRINFFGGQLDSIKIWNRVLSDADVLADYEEGKQHYPSLLNRVKRRRSYNAAAAAGGGFRSRIAGGLVVTAS